MVENENIMDTPKELGENGALPLIIHRILKERDEMMTMV